MKVLNENLEEITSYDPEKGSLTETVRIRPDAVPVDNISKFVYEDGDYEPIMIYRPYEDGAATETPSTEETLLELAADHEYRLCMLELGGEL